MEADAKFLIFYWCMCIFVIIAFYFLVGISLVSLFAGGVVLGFAVAMSIFYVQERMAKRRYHYRRS